MRLPGIVSTSRSSISVGKAVGIRVKFVLFAITSFRKDVNPRKTSCGLNTAFCHSQTMSTSASLALKFAYHFVCRANVKLK